jgi:putative component of membrane protein insertase Oxa1/YidC/SpoIIIJ protein YidD
MLLLMVPLYETVSAQTPLPALDQPVQGEPAQGELDAEVADNPPLAHQIAFFRRILSKADGDRCNMHPSCSTYALESLRKHGALMGWVMTCDRLLRCGHDEVRLAPTVRRGDRGRAYDPVSGNDFWWWSPPSPETASAAGP